MVATSSTKGGYPFWVNGIDALPHAALASLHINDIFACSQDDTTEAWENVLLANYMIDLHWLLQAVPAVTKVKEKVVILSGERGTATMDVTWPSPLRPVLIPKSRSADKNNSFLETARSCGLDRERLEILEPPLPFPYGTHHTKMALCVNRRGLRVAIFTANFVHSDWTCKTQGIFVQDFPRASSHSHSREGDDVAARGIDFRHQLRLYLRCCGISPHSPSHPLGFFSTDFLEAFDFSAAKVWLVCSVPGRHVGEMATCFGMNRLAQVLERVRKPGKNNHQDCQSVPSQPQRSILSWQYSSQGALTKPFLLALQCAMTGDPLSTGGDSVQVQVIYPTEEEVRSSLEGWRGGLSLPLRLKNCHPFVNTRLFRWGKHQPSQEHDVHHAEFVDVDAMDDPVGSSADESLTTFQPSNGGYQQYALPHIKTYAEIDFNRSYLRWFLLTSANLSQAAWGTPSTEVQARKALFIRSYEVGVLYDSTSAVDRGEELFTVIPSRPLSIPVSGDNHNLFAVPLHAEESRSGVPSLLLPYDILHPQPYALTQALQEHRGKGLNKIEIGSASLSRSARDLPWVVDVCHQGTDSLGRTTKQAIQDYSHYGEASWQAHVVDPGVGAERRRPDLGRKRPRSP